MKPGNKTTIGNLLILSASALLLLSIGVANFRGAAQPAVGAVAPAAPAPVTHDSTHGGILSTSVQVPCTKAPGEYKDGQGPNCNGSNDGIYIQIPTSSVYLVSDNLFTGKFRLSIDTQLILSADNQSLKRTDARGGETTYTRRTISGGVYEWTSNEPARDPRRFTLSSDAKQFLCDMKGGFYEVYSRANTSQPFKFSGTTDANGNARPIVWGANSVSVTEQGNLTTTIALDAGGNPTQFTDMRGKMYSAGYDSSGRLITFIYPDGKVTNVGYDGTSTLPTSVLYAGDTVPVLYTYASGGEIRKIEHGTDSTVFNYTATSVEIATSRGKSTYTYSGGLLASQKDQNGDQYTYTRDAATKRVTSVAGPYGQAWSYTYYSDGRVSSETTAYGTTAYEYDARGNTTKRTVNGSATTSLFNSLDRPTKVTLPTGFVIDYTYDGGGNLLTVSQGGAVVQTNTYNLQGKLLTSSTPEGTVTNTYDSNGNLASTTDARGLTTTYTFNATGDFVGSRDPAGFETAVDAYNVYGSPTTKRTFRSTGMASMDFDRFKQLVRGEDSEAAAETPICTCSGDCGSQQSDCGDECCKIEYPDDTTDPSGCKITGQWRIVACNNKPCKDAGQHGENTSCDDNNDEPVLCPNDGADCTKDEDCCNPNVCKNSKCQPSSSSSGGSSSSSGGSNSSTGSSSSSSGTPPCDLAKKGDSCSSDNDCCDDLVCEENKCAEPLLGLFDFFGLLLIGRFIRRRRNRQPEL